MLRNYQEKIANEAAYKLKKYKIAYLAMEVRTGKTFTALAAAEKYGAIRVLFISKKKALNSIQKDYEALRPLFKMELINFESIHKVKNRYDLIIIDEAHSLGQFPRPALKVNKIKDIAINKPIIYLSGTPTPESFSQIYHQFYVSSFSPFKAYRNFYQWAQDYVKITQIRTSSGFVNNYKEANVEKIKEKTDHLFITYTQKEAGFKHYEVKEEIINIEDEQTERYIKELIKNKVLKTDKIDVMVENTFGLMQKVSQLSSGTVINNNEKVKYYNPVKLKYIKTEGQKVAIYYKYTAEKKMIMDYFKKENITEDPEEFNNSDKIFIGQLKAAREGVNLSTGDVIYILTPDFSATSYYQILGRIQHLNREKQNKLVWLLMGDFDKSVYGAIMNKMKYTSSYFKRDYLKTARRYL